jgi:hypothetical protein
MCLNRQRIGIFDDGTSNEYAWIGGKQINLYFSL